MVVDGKHYRTIWVKERDPRTIQVIDQRLLPHQFVIRDLRSAEEMVQAIRDMTVRGAPLIGVAAAYGMYLAALEAPKNHCEAYLVDAAQMLKNTRPTAINLMLGISWQLKIVREAEGDERVARLLASAHQMAEEEILICKQIGEIGLSLIEKISERKKGKTVNILTHCNAGWLACIDWGTATSPIYHALRKKISVHVWVDETRPRNQGASLTAWELAKEGVPHTVIVDSAGGYLMQKGLVDLVLTGTDRTTRSGDAANKIGTYLKALAAHDNGIPFFVALPSTSIDWSPQDGLSEIPIEERDPEEVHTIQGLCNGEVKSVRLTPENCPALNVGFDVTPARLITGFITERGICEASSEGLFGLFPGQRA